MIIRFKNYIATESEIMIRTITRPSTARCTLPMYIGFLLSEPNGVSCRRLGNIASISHDSANRFLNRECYEPKDLYREVEPTINTAGGTLSVDDSVLDKPYAQYISLIGHYYSGKHHKVVKGINLITLYYTDPQGKNQPVNFRVYDKKDGKTKNDYFLDMLVETLDWGLKPSFVTGDSWYSCVKNLKAVKNHQLGFLFALESNRLVSIEKGTWAQVQSLNIPVDGLIVWLRDFGHIKLFRTNLKDQIRHYAMYLPDDTNPISAPEEKLVALNEVKFDTIHSQHWQIEQYHRTIKQVCNIESFQVRGKTAVKNHLFAAILGYVELQRLRAADLISNCYRLRRELFNDVITSFINTFVQGKEHLNPKFHSVVNA